MKVNKKIYQQSRSLFKSMTKINLSEENKIRLILSNLTFKSKSKAVSLLSALEKQSLKQEDEEKLIIESAFPLAPEQIKQIATHFEHKLKSQLTIENKLDPKLIGGIRIRNRDNIWENSIESKLDLLKGKISYG